PLDGSFRTGSSGASVHAYVIDSGIRTSHAEFGGRASVGVDVVGDGRNGQDCVGHGTMVAGLLGGATTGVAKGVSLGAVRVVAGATSVPRGRVSSGAGVGPPRARRGPGGQRCAGRPPPPRRWRPRWRTRSRRVSPTRSRRGTRVPTPVRRRPPSSPRPSPSPR